MTFGFAAQMFGFTMKQQPLVQSDLVRVILIASTPLSCYTKVDATMCHTKLHVMEMQVDNLAVKIFIPRLNTISLKAVHTTYELVAGKAQLAQVL
jgi:hypothetical protein